jgi:hypothetical protein
MICSHHTRTVAFLLVAFVAAASHAQATQQAAPAAPAAPATVGTEPFAPAATSGSSPVTVTVARSYETNASVALPSSSLLADVPNAGSVTEPVLVIPGKPMDAQAIDQAVEDLSVMSRIIEKNAFAQEGTLDAFGDMGALLEHRQTWGV